MIDSESPPLAIDWQARALSAEAKLVRAKVAIVCILERVTELEGLIQGEPVVPAAEAQS